MTETSQLGPGPGQKTVLIVDDNPTNLRLVSDVLESRGYRLARANSGEDALEVLSWERPDLVLLDVQMPGLSGTDVVRLIRASPATHDLKVVAVTAMAMRGDRETILAAGFDAYLAKPYKLSELVSTVAAWLEADRPARAASERSTG